MDRGTIGFVICSSSERLVLLSVPMLAVALVALRCIILLVKLLPVHCLGFVLVLHHLLLHGLMIRQALRLVMLLLADVLYRPIGCLTVMAQPADWLGSRVCVLLLE